MRDHSVLSLLVANLLKGPDHRKVSYVGVAVDAPHSDVLQCARRRGQQIDAISVSAMLRKDPKIMNRALLASLFRAASKDDGLRKTYERFICCICQLPPCEIGSEMPWIWPHILPCDVARRRPGDPGFVAFIERTLEHPFHRLCKHSKLTLLQRSELQARWYVNPRTGLVPNEQDLLLLDVGMLSQKSRLLRVCFRPASPLQIRRTCSSGARAIVPHCPTDLQVPPIARPHSRALLPNISRDLTVAGELV